jgi:hypothetical protein
MDQEAMIENLRWWSQMYLWLAIGLPILAGIAAGVLNLKRQYIEGELRELRAQQTQAQFNTSQAQAHELQQRLTEAQQQSVAEQTFRNVQAQQRARTLTQEQHRTLIGQLQAGPKGEVRVEFPSGDAEAEQFAAQFYEVLMHAGWTMQPFAQVQHLGEIPVGLQVGPSQEKSERLAGRQATLPPHGELLLQALRDVGLKVSLKRIPRQGSAEIVYLVVGAKPQPR